MNDYPIIGKVEPTLTIVLNKGTASIMFPFLSNLKIEVPDEIFQRIAQAESFTLIGPFWRKDFHQTIQWPEKEKDQEVPSY